MYAQKRMKAIAESSKRRKILYMLGMTRAFRRCMDSVAWVLARMSYLNICGAVGRLNGILAMIWSTGHYIKLAYAHSLALVVHL